MKTKMLLIALPMLIPFLFYSQTDTDNKVILDFEIGKFIALDLVELDRLREVDSINTVLLQNFKKQVGTLEEVSAGKSEQINLLNEIRTVLEAQLESEKANKPKAKWVTWSLAVLAFFGLGFVLGAG